MQLSELTVKNWLAFEDASIRLVPNGITMLVGPNNAGKSALLNAIAKVVAPGSTFEGLRLGSGSTRIEATYDVPDRWRDRLLNETFGDHTERWADAGAMRRVAFVFETFRRPAMRLLEVQGTVDGTTLVPVVRFDPNNHKVSSVNWQPIAASQQPRAITLDQAVNIQPSIESLEQFGRAPAISYLEALNEWRSGFYHFLPIRQGGGDQGTASNNTPDLQPRGENLAEHLLWIKINDDRSWDRIKRVVAELVPDVGELSIETSGQPVRVYFDQPGVGKVYLKALGTGVEQLLMIVAVGVRGRTGGTLLVEEPETGLHPEAQRWLLRYLSEWSAQRQIVVSTHSTVFLDRSVDMQAPVYSVRRSCGASTVAESTADPRGVLADLGVRLSDFLSADGVVLVEGKTDVGPLERWFGPEMHNANVRVVVAGGGDSAWDVDRFAGWTQKAQELHAQVLFMRDRDELPDSKVEQLEESGAVVVLRRRELENYFLVPSAIEAVLVKQGVTSCGVVEIEQRLRSLKDALKVRVVLKRLAYDLGSVRPLDRRDVQELLRGRVDLDAVLAKIGSHRVTRQRVRELWRRHRADVDAAWPARWMELVEGSELLDLVWRSNGRRYQKEVGIELAAHVDPPIELADAVGHFLKRLSR